MNNTKFIKFNKILLFVTMVLILMIFNTSNLYAASVNKLLKPETYPIDGWDGEDAISGGTVNESWYYVVTNYEDSAYTIGIDIHGATSARLWWKKFTCSC